MPEADLKPTDDGYAPRRGFPWRGMALGAVMSYLVVASSIYFNSRLARQGISNDMLAACAVFYLIVLCGLVNPLLKLVDRRLGFSGPDLFRTAAQALKAILKDLDVAWE